MSDYSPRSNEMIWLVGVASLFLLIATIGLSFVADGSSKSSPTSNRGRELKILIIQQEAQIKKLKIREDSLQTQLDAALDTKIAHDAAVVASANLQEIINTLANQNGDLLSKLSKTQDTNEALEAEFQEYRKEYRKAVWQRNRNRLLTSRDFSGKPQFNNAKISSIDAAGLLVQHDAGASRIPVDQLSQKLRDELDLDPAEARVVMMELHAKDAKGKARRHAAAQEKDQPVLTEGEILNRESELLATMKIKARNLHRLTTESQAEADRARHMNLYSKNRSVPASLETWAQRSIRFDRLSNHYAAQLAAALSKIHELDPLYEVDPHQ